ncbi:cation-translocating P-type ATPase [Clostridium bowmanii]|uniref:cation-translocating P-type ATPase n=1 Tax=Clostridium bowmanii TaxID=132925 RepID=UPI001C0B41A5|nr:cation-translocating P-type ATPase [Clostridium bowmanii]MBU3191454.1 cation-translocating P-type ATPase [Clostridium bowmanii]MCA1075632.1 cation-translocating P-type ATPase [Clostridium bowmanii]
MESESLKGLSTEQVKSLREKYGFNELIKIKKSNPILKFLSVFKEPMFILLVGAATLYFILGEPREGSIMLIFVMFVATITFVQEWKTEKTMDALKDLTSPHVVAMRNGKKQVIKSCELVPSDIIFLSEGNRIPADCEVMEESNFSVDESSLTGESEPVYKLPLGSIDSSKSYWKQDTLYAGTLSNFGKCTARVTTIGFETEYGKIGKAISETNQELSPLQKKVSQLVKTLAIAGFILCIMVIGFSYMYTGEFVKSILAGVTLAMAIIPEEFPVVLTIFLSLGAFRLAKKNTLIRKIPAVETLGSTTVLCVDKTGTITQNIMRAKVIYRNGFVDPDKLKDKDLAKLLVLACERDPYDPMEKAIVNAGKDKINIHQLYNLELTKKFAFDSKTKRMANIYKENGAYYVAAKGSPETILPLCNLTQNEDTKILDTIDDMASKGLRVLALADLVTNTINDHLDQYRLCFKGLIGLQDPPKAGVQDAINNCKKAGVRVMMITGDYSKTAIAIGNEIGLNFYNCAITGEEIDAMTVDELSTAVSHCDIFSRVIPEHKMKIVKALKKNGEIVAMTGDGVNDAPALKNANIGIAMGKRGTEVAKEAADMILMDDNFTTIVHSIEDGRRVFDNIRKAMVYIMIIHIPIMALALFSPIFNLPQILLPVHIVLLELILDPTCSIVFEGEPAEDYIMEQPPRSPSEPLLTKKLTRKVIFQGTTLFLAAFLPFHYMVDSGFSADYARTFSLMVLIVGNVVLVLVNRSNTKYLISLFKEKGSKARFYINSLALVMLFSIVYISAAHPIFKTVALDFKTAIIACLLGAVSTGWWEIVKFLSNSKHNKIIKNSTINTVNTTKNI